jgi:hypothetical protein
MTAVAGLAGFQRLRRAPARPAGRHRRPRAVLRVPRGRHSPGRRLAGRRNAAGWPATVIVICGVLATGAGLTGLAVSPWAGTPRPSPPPGPARPVRAPGGPVAAPLTAAAAARPVARPVRLIIPVIGVRARLVRLGLADGGALQVPATTTVAGWYTGSPRPGAIGSSVIAGHVDSYLGPGVFFRLRLLRPGDRISVRRADGTLAVFRVTLVRTYLKTRFPTGAVYGPAPGRQLRLITCGGTFDPGLRTYLSNVVVYAAAAG